jgi:hypothetical protein
MIYTYCNDTLVFERVKTRRYLKFGLVLCLIALMIAYTSYVIGEKSAIKKMSAEERITLIKDSDEFSQGKMASMMKDLNIKFPWIPMAQSMLETGKWKSDIFVENNNLFGMREAKSRITTAIGTNKNHAEYNSWRESIYDYAFYQSRYLGKIQSEEEYYQYLDASYAEDPSYIKKVKQMVERHKLKQLFK